ncbi:MAG: putative phosphoribosylformimino-5-aminoimidazole carboxamideribonucleotide isomerase, partial [Proteobacteria bacterium]|nr:putative phosphoribosylformimino-5-aminoimidazole carboxamideribonucleotide isomerase [Pseudomonadota bacterium]
TEVQLIPAIDLLNGEVVRLRHGDFDESTLYDISPGRLAKNYAAAGAQWLHVVDLAASRDGGSADRGSLMKLLGMAPQSIQTGGGVRVAQDVRARLQHGAERVVVGTICVTQTHSFLEWLDEFGPDHIVSALDVAFDADGTPRPRTHGWTRGSERSLWQVLDELAGHGLKHLLCTDISKDGALHGPNVDLYGELAARYPDLEIQASGGVSGLRDLEQLKSTGVSAAIVGKALLEGCFTVEEALEVLA